MNNLATLGLLPSRMTRLLCNQPVRGLRDLIDWSNTGKSSAANITPWVALQEELHETSAAPSVEVIPTKAEVESKAPVEAKAAVESKAAVDEIPSSTVVDEVTPPAPSEPVREAPVAAKEPIAPEPAPAPPIEAESKSVEKKLEVQEVASTEEKLAVTVAEKPVTLPPPEPSVSVKQEPSGEVASKEKKEIEVEPVAAAMEKPAVEAAKPLVAQAKKAEVAEKAEVVVAETNVAVNAKPPTPVARVEEPKVSTPVRAVAAEPKVMPPSIAASRPQSVPQAVTQPLPPVPSPRAAVPSGSESDYLMQLERLVVQLNYELGMKQMQSPSEGPEQWMVQRMIELNLRNLELQDQLANALRTGQMSGAK